MVSDTAADHAAGRRREGLSALAQVVSLLGSPVEPPVLARVLDMDIGRLRSCLDLLVLDGVLSASDGEYNTVAGVRREVTLLPGTVALMHRRAADCLVELSSPPNAERAARIALHYEAAACFPEAFRWWCEACGSALARGSVRLALGHLEHALRICSANAGAVSLEDELGALNLMGPICAQLEGSGAEEVAAVYARSAALADHSVEGRCAARFDALWGLTACILVHGRIDTARELAAKLVRIAEDAEDSAPKILATRLSGLGNLLAGKLTSAISDFTVVHRLYRRKQHAGLRFSYASDQGAVALAHKAWAKTIAGREAEAERTGQAALELSNAIRHPHTSAHVTCVLAARAQILGERGVAAPLAIAAHALAKRHDFAYWLAWSDLIMAWHAGTRDPDEGIVRVRAGIAAYQRTGAVQALPYAHLMLADLALGAGDRQLSSEAADAGLAITMSSGVRLFEAELTRLKGLAADAGPLRRQLLRQAAAIARRQGAQLFFGRAMAALADGQETSTDDGLFAN